MNIGEVSKAVDLPVKTIRYYEDIGLVTPDRLNNGYRFFDDLDVERLKLVGRARNLGFGVEACRRLLALYNDTGRASSDVKQLAIEHLAEIDQKIAELESLRKLLLPMVEACKGNEDADCAILDGLVHPNQSEEHD